VGFWSDLYQNPGRLALPDGGAGPGGQEGDWLGAEPDDGSGSDQCDRLADGHQKQAHHATLMFHSDRSVQYACQQFRSQLKGKLVRQRMSRKGNCWDNAVAESFFKTIKTELIYNRKFATWKEARLAVFEYIEGWYNRRRRHSTLGYRTPCHFESLFHQNLKAYSSKNYSCLKKPPVNCCNSSGLGTAA
jgi:hypothetical protein